MKQNFTLPEMQAALRMAGIAPAPGSPLAGVVPAVAFDPAILESLRGKGVWDGTAGLHPEWQGALSSLAAPSMQASVYIEGVGIGRYYGGAGGVVTMGPLDGGQQRVVTGLSTDTVVDEVNQVLGWRATADPPPLRHDFSTEELTTVVAIVDACRDEQLRAVLERRPPQAGRVSREEAERQVAVGRSKPDAHWLVSIVSQFAPPACAPRVEALDAGAASLLGRGWATTGNGCLQLGPELEALCSGFAMLNPFFVIAVGAPLAEPEVALFMRGAQGYWAIEFPSAARRHATVWRAGGKAIEETLRRMLAGMTVAAAPPPQPPLQWGAAAAVSAPPPLRVEAVGVAGPPASPPVPLRAAHCPGCGQKIGPDVRFCTGCGAPVRR